MQGNPFFCSDPGRVPHRITFGCILRQGRNAPPLRWVPRLTSLFPDLETTRPQPSSRETELRRGRMVNKWTTRPGLRPASTPRIDGSRAVGPRGVGAGHPAIRVRRAATNPGYSRPAYAALDLGTNNCRLLVARPIREGFRVVDAFSRIIRLGEGMAASGRLGEAAIQRAIEALSICRDKMRNRGATRARLIATEACRSAANGAEFRERVQREVGLDLEIVDRETEAELAAIGCTPLMDPEAEGVILFDIGGGSSEIVLLGRNEPARGGPPNPKIRAWASLPVGVVSLAERYGGVTVDDCALRGHDRRSDGACAALRRRALRRHQPCRDAPARDLRHGDDDCRAASAPQALRPAPGGRLLDDRRPGERGAR